MRNSHSNDDTCECSSNQTASDSQPAMEYLPAILYTQGSLTVVFNLLLCLGILTSAKLRTWPNYLFVSNGIADLLVGVYLFPETNVRWMPSTCHRIPQITCVFHTVIGSHLHAVSVMHWVAISVERLLRAFYVNLHKRIVRRWLLPAIVICWSVAGVAIYPRRLLPWTLSWYPYDVEDPLATTDTCQALTAPSCQCRFCVNRLQSGIALFFQFFAPLIVAIVCYTCIMVGTYRRIREANRTRLSLSAITDHPTGIEPRRLSLVPLERFFSSREFRRIRLFLMILLAFTVCVGQHICFRIPILLNSGNQQTIKDLPPPREDFFVWTSSSKNGIATDLIAFSNSLINPILLFAISRNFRRSLVNVLCFFRQQKALIDDPPSSRRREICNRLHIPPP
ncbi:hypothetical protein BV898_17080 [Hypsibius exemplaris]|uniref:G-protein coupled receptors family 1 profile domain-containing protein n=1 Tax=Hypsibius exemplaris TaxID=2072580 RepID=A0A9X6NGK5_HYPEX|nr:hypothetical protein BV898_17080 [Hypsibius exemplaris]